MPEFTVLTVIFTPTDGSPLHVKDPSVIMVAEAAAANVGHGGAGIGITKSKSKLTSQGPVELLP